MIDPGKHFHALRTDRRFQTVCGLLGTEAARNLDQVFHRVFLALAISSPTQVVAGAARSTSRVMDLIG